MSTENGPLGVYRMKPIYNPQMNIELPTCMYKLRPIYDSDKAESASEEQQGGSDDVAEQLLGRLGSSLQKLEDIKSEVEALKKKFKITERKKTSPPQTFLQKKPVDFKPQEVVVKASPEFPPYSLWVFFFFLRDKFNAQLVTYTHSSLNSLPANLKGLSGSRNDGKFDLTVTVIWKETGKNPEMVVDPTHQGLIETEINVARYLSRLLSPGYDSKPYEAFQIDYWLELAHSLVVHGSSEDHNSALKNLDSHLNNKYFLVGDALSVADIVIWSTLLQYRLHRNLPANVAEWWRSLMEMDLFKNVATYAN